MKKTLYILSSLFLTIIMQAQLRPQPKPGPAPTINIGKPKSFELQNGLKVMVVENHKLPRVSYTLTMDNVPYLEKDKKGVTAMLGRLMGSGTQKITKDAFNEEVDFLGANVSFSDNGAYGSGLSKYANRILELMADGALNPVFTQEEFDKEKAKLLESLRADEKSVPAVARRIESVLAYGKNHPSGEYLSEATINNVTLADVQSNYNTYFVPENAYLIIIGDVNFDTIKTQVEDLFDPWQKATAPNLSYANPKDVQYTQINFVDMPNAVQSEISVMNVSDLKMTDKDYFATIVANQVLGGDFNSYLNMNLREKHGWTYGAESAIRGSKYTSRFIAFSQVRNAVVDSAVVEFMKEIRRIRTEKVSEDMLRDVKAGYVGNFVMQIEKPQTVAGYALRIRTQGLPEDFYQNYIKNINAVTADDVLRVANKYFQVDKTRICIVGKGAEIIPALEKIKIPILFFDKFGNPIAKPDYKTPIATGVTAKTVLDNYIKNIGGEKALTDVKSIMMVASGTIQGTPVELTTKTTKGKQFREVKAMGMSMMKQVVNDKGAYVMNQGQKKELIGDNLNDAKAEATPFVELSLTKKTGVSLEGIEKLNDKDVYVIKDGKMKLYYDVKSGLKVAQSATVGMGEQQMTQMVTFDDYRDVKGIKVPYEMVLNLGFEINLMTTEVKINEGVSDTDFQ
jgi:zinc protease